jgi:hypothetical protein
LNCDAIVAISEAVGLKQFFTAVPDQDKRVGALYLHICYSLHMGCVKAWLETITGK